MHTKQTFRLILFHFLDQSHSRKDMKLENKRAETEFHFRKKFAFLPKLFNAQHSFYDVLAQNTSFKPPSVPV